MDGAQAKFASLTGPAQQRVERKCREFRGLVEAGQRADLPSFLDDSSGDERSVLLRELLTIELEWQSDQGVVPDPDNYSDLPGELRSVVESVFAERLETLVPSEVPLAGASTPGRQAAHPAAAERTVGPGIGDTQPARNHDAGWDAATLAPSEQAAIGSSQGSVSASGAPAQAAANEAASNDTDADGFDSQATSLELSNDPLETLDEFVVETEGDSAETEGDSGYGAATIDEQQLTPEIRSRLARLRSRPTSSSARPPDKVIGDYEILGELGQGGMGVVYRARQRKANRIVALKVIRPDRLSGMSESTRTRMIDRFRNEAQAAGRLQHDNLVTVFEVGEADGCHYFSMPFIEGGSLAEKLRDGPLENRQAAEFLEPICRAVHAAHQLGILHRDIKPQNILIEHATQRPRIADFGLAKLATDEQTLTKTGEAMGTPPYMPPEQFNSAADATAQSDVYSLGATLYHALSGRPPFQAASTFATMRQVLEHEPVALQQLNTAVDRDLSTICMKCLEKDPARRFESAAALADELRRYLDGKPILSRPISRTARLLKWCRRNRILAGAIFVTATGLLFGGVSLAVAYVKTEDARIAVEKSLGETKQAQELSEASFQDALEAVNQFFTHVSEDRLLNEPGSQELRRELLDLARNYYLRFLDRRSNDPTVRDELAATHFRLGLITEELDSPQAAVESLETARKQQSELLGETPDSKPRRRALSRTLAALGRVATLNGDLDTATQLFEQTRTMRQQLVDETDDPANRVEFDRLLANADMNLGLLAKRQRDFERALELFNTAQDLRLATLKQFPQETRLRRDLAKGWYNLANLGVDQNLPDRVATNIDKAIELFEQLLTENPDDLRDRYLLAVCLRLKGDLLAALVPTKPESLGEAIDVYGQARLQMQDLSQRSPAVMSYRQELGELLLNMAQLEAQRQQYDSSRGLLEEARRLFERLVSEAPDRPEFAQQIELIDRIREELERLASQATRSSQ
ncbi:protein kinase [bacterium]|nr:protein kinase [bacterium]